MDIPQTLNPRLANICTDAATFLIKRMKEEKESLSNIECLTVITGMFATLVTSMPGYDGKKLLGICLESLTTLHKNMKD